MTTIDPTSDAATAVFAVSSADSSRAGRAVAGVVNWLTSADHKKTGRMFLGAGLLGLLATVVINVLWSLERADVANAVEADTASQLADAQIIGMILGGMAPLVVGLCVAVVPLQTGARSIAFPRLAVLGLWMWLGGLVLNVIALANNGGSLGGDGDMVDLFLASIAMMAIGLAAAAASVAVTVLTTRAPGMTMRRVPFFSMSALITALGLLLMMPVLLGTTIYLFLDHRNARDGFGGNSGTYEWIGWFFTTPAIFLLAIPALGVLAEMAPITFRKRSPARGVVYAGMALVGVAAFAGVSQTAGYNVPWAGSKLYLGGREDVREKLYDVVPWALFNLLPILGVTIVFLMLAVVAKPQKGMRVNVTPAFAFSLLGVGMVLVGMLGNALHGIDDLALQNTVFQEGSVNYVVYGTVLAIMGGVAHWAPKLWGRTMPVAQTLPLAGLGVLAVVLASLPNYIAGFLNQDAGFATAFDSDLRIWSILVLVGHVLMALTVVAFVGLLLKTMLGEGDHAADDPHEAQTLEWTTTSPAPSMNFAEPPTVMSAEPVLDSHPYSADIPGSDS